MGLVGYSESESSGDEAPVQTVKQSKPTTSKTGFQKFTDGENRHKIKVNLPIGAQSKDDSANDDEPAPKRAKMSGGGFNAMLPAPKRPKAALASSGRGRGLGSGVNLKTGAAPGFSREIPENPNDGPEADLEPYSNVAEDNFTDSSSQVFAPETSSSEPPKPTGTAMKFKPLSVSRKPKKKLAAALMSAMGNAPTANQKTVPAKPKASLFSTPITDDSQPEISSGEYKPMIYSTSSGDDTVVDQEDGEPPDLSYTSGDPAQSLNQPSSQISSQAQPQSLSTIADSLNLSASQRRQLLGRKGVNFADANIVEFNTETEYAANEELRARGETATFNAVRSVASGKHSLQQLVSLVSNQKEALEESFAAGKRNKKEAGAKYGW